MAIRDLLWACPLCGTVGGLRPVKGGEACATCGALFRRGRGSTIEVRLPDGRVDTRPAPEWAAALPHEPPVLGEPLSTAVPSSAPGSSGQPRGEGTGGAGAREAATPRLWRRDRVRARFAVEEEPIRLRGTFLGTMERLGPPCAGSLALTDRALELSLDDGEEHRWALEDLAALQASSHTIQVRPKREPIVSLQFPDASPRLWEESIAAALRARWRLLGLGEIAEFHPRIVARQPASGGR